MMLGLVNQNDVMTKEHVLSLIKLSKESGTPVNLIGANLDGLDLTGFNLEKAVMCGAKLRGTILNDAILTRADLSMAKLNRVSMKNAVLCRVNFKLADLYEANLRGSNLYCADMSNTNLRESNLSGTNMLFVNLFGARLHNANFAESNGIMHASCTFDGHGEAGRNLLGVAICGNITLFCGCWQGSPEELKDYIDKGTSGYKRTRTIAADFVVSRLEYMIDQSHWKKASE